MLGFKTIEQFTPAECDEFLKRTDIGDADRRRAEERRNFLLHQPQPAQKTILELFPEYGFMPTSVVKGNTFLKVLSVLFLIAAVGFYIAGLVIEIRYWEYNKEMAWIACASIMIPIIVLAMFFLFVYRKDNKHGEIVLLTIELLALPIMILNTLVMDDHTVLAHCGDFWLLLSCFTLIMLSLLYCRMRIASIADYIAKKCFNKSSKRYFIFVKDRKFGIVKKGLYKTIVPAEYDKLSWRDDNTLAAEQDGQTFLIDIFGNRLS